MHAGTLRTTTLRAGATALAALLVAGGLAGCGAASEEHPAYFPAAFASEKADDPVPPVDSMTFDVPPPPFRDPEVFPCSGCHDNKDLVANPERRVLKMAHDDIVLHHDEEHRWCLDCHDAQNRDRLRLANGTLIPFEQSYRLCGQCHGDKYRDWRAGVHGRRTGEWDGKKGYLLCVNCHWSHAPHFAPIQPLPPPRRPEAVKTGSSTLVVVPTAPPRPGPTEAAPAKPEASKGDGAKPASAMGEGTK